MKVRISTFISIHKGASRPRIFRRTALGGVVSRGTARPHARGFLTYLKYNIIITSQNLFTKHLGRILLVLTCI